MDITIAQLEIFRLRGIANRFEKYPDKSVLITKKLCLKHTHDCHFQGAATYLLSNKGMVAFHNSMDLLKAEQDSLEAIVDPFGERSSIGKKELQQRRARAKKAIALAFWEASQENNP